MQECTALEHGDELLVRPLEDLLNGRRIRKARPGLLHPHWRYGAKREGDVVGNPAKDGEI